MGEPEKAHQMHFPLNGKLHHQRKIVSVWSLIVGAIHRKCSR